MKKVINALIFIILVLLVAIVIIYFTSISKQTTSQGEENIVVENVINSIVIDTQSEENILNEENFEEKSYKGDFELPINGATGFASVLLPLYEKINSNVIKNIQAGQAFRIISESRDYFYVELSDFQKGYVESKYCLVNLPDIIPSIIYNDTNSYKSIFRSSGYALDGITDKALYNAYFENNRFDQKQYVMPLLYPMTKKIAKIQKEALKNGDCLTIYETFRPYDVQMNVSDALTKLMDSNETVKKGINSKPWDKSWFIAVQLSNHQRGIALDVSLSMIKEKEYKYCGDYAYFTVSDYEEYNMPTKMHELSKAAATFTTPVSSKSKTDWKKAKLASSMNSYSKKLQNYFISFGLTPLASEWWHFNDLDTRELTKDKESNGKFFLTECLSSIPNS